ncbi:hypothetical protein PanWU01x14_295350 [Parasponia andersonii]|uniref:Uncharacterized protein n=1 Tax=Parasponia andersonii TaxID=3476 RepID=A0A2P5AVN4_PARAD|nr:hypothetical protein PanWU01x14_295350 [Parasponia andersonii]
MRGLDQMEPRLEWEVGTLEEGDKEAWLNRHMQLLLGTLKGPEAQSIPHQRRFWECTPTWHVVHVLQTWCNFHIIAGPLNNHGVPTVVKTPKLSHLASSSSFVFIFIGLMLNSLWVLSSVMKTLW